MTWDFVIICCLVAILYAHSVGQRSFDRHIDRAVWNLENWKGWSMIPRGLTRKRNLPSSEESLKTRKEKRS